MCNSLPHPTLHAAPSPEMPFHQLRLGKLISIYPSQPSSNVSSLTSSQVVPSILHSPGNKPPSSPSWLSHHWTASSSGPLSSPPLFSLTSWPSLAQNGALEIVMVLENDLDPKIKRERSSLLLSPHFAAATPASSHTRSCSSCRASALAVSSA